MQVDDVNLLRQRLKNKEKKLQTAGAEGDTISTTALAIELELIKIEINYLEAGGATLETPDDTAHLNFLLKEKRLLFEELIKYLNRLPENHITRHRYRDIEQVLKAQQEYINAKNTVISENRNLRELGRWIEFAEKEGVNIIASPLEHEAQLGSFRPEKVERKKDFVIEFRNIAIALAVLLLLTSFYFGLFWRKTPYDRSIIRNYVVARNAYLSANEHYVSGNYKSSEREYTISASFFNKAKREATMASNSKSGKMQTYFDYKMRFFEQWELISLKMGDSSNSFRSENYEIGASHAGEAVEMAELAGQYNRQAEEAWKVF